MVTFINPQKCDALCITVPRLPDSRGKTTAEGFVRMVSGEDLQRIAGTEVEKCYSCSQPQNYSKSFLLQPTSTGSHLTGNHVVTVFHLYVCGAGHTGVKAADGAEDINAFEFFVGVI